MHNPGLGLVTGSSGNVQQQQQWGDSTTQRSRLLLKPPRVSGHGAQSRNQNAHHQQRMQHYLHGGSNQSQQQQLVQQSSSSSNNNSNNNYGHHMPDQQSTQQSNYLRKMERYKESGHSSGYGDSNNNSGNNNRHRQKMMGEGNHRSGLRAAAASVGNNNVYSNSNSSDHDKDNNNSTFQIGGRNAHAGPVSPRGDNNSSSHGSGRDFTQTTVGTSGEVTQSRYHRRNANRGNRRRQKHLQQQSANSTYSNSNSSNNNSHQHQIQSNSQQQQSGAGSLPAITGGGRNRQAGGNAIAIGRDPGGLQMVTEEHSTVGVGSIKGHKPGNPNWINQDNFFVVERFDSKEVNYYCVLDGHGELGHFVSRRCRENFPQFIRGANHDTKKAFAMMQNDLNNCDFDVRCSGATCVLACLVGNRLAVSNCGDSRAVLGRRAPNGSYVAVALSHDHKPDRPEERKRILSCGGHLGCRQVLVSQGARGPVTMPVGPCRVWYQYRGDTLGLAMSRSLGDSIVHRSGVSADPEVLEYVVEDYDDFIIMATDGVWDVVDNNQAVQIVQSFAAKSGGHNWSPLEAATWVCKFARGRWEKLSPMVDDITCLVIKLSHPKPIQQD